MIREIQIKTTVRDHLIPIKIMTIQKQHTKNNNTKEKIASVCKDVEKLKGLFSVGMNLKWYSHSGKQHGGSLQN